jgi:bacteriocin biosynthesis cyclodehydratase domain-containing protein
MADNRETVERPGGDDLGRPFTRNPHLTIIHCGDDEVVIKHGSRSRFTKNIRDEGRTRLLGKILRNVVPPASLAELRERGILKEGDLADSINLVEYLRREGVLVDPGEDPTRLYLDVILGGTQPLATRTVALAGAGSLGSRIAVELARLGIGRLIVLDDRTVENETVDRLYFDLDPGVIRAGRPYVECLQDHLAARGFGALEVLAEPLDSERAMQAVADRCDFLVVALEVFSARTLHLANSVAIDAGRPWMSVFVDGSEALVGPLYLPGESCCYNEFEIQHEATLGAMKDDYLLYKEALNEEKVDGSHFALPPYLGVASGLAVTALLRFLVSGRSFLVGRCNRLDFERLSVDYEEVLRLPRCPACSSSRPGYRHLFM